MATCSALAPRAAPAALPVRSASRVVAPPPARAAPPTRAERPARPAPAPARRPPPRRGGDQRPRPIRRTIRVGLPFDHLGHRLVDVAFEAHGPRGAPATVVLGGISASRHLAPTPADPSRGWWRGMVGRGAALDPARRRLIGVDYLGGPAPDGLLRPVTTRDQARAVAAVLDELGAQAADLVGASYGAMVAHAFAELFPGRVARLVLICGAHRPHPMATAIRSVQRSIARLGVASGRPAEGLALARALAMTTYRSAEEFERRFAAAADFVRPANKAAFAPSPPGASPLGPPPDFVRPANKVPSEPLPELPTPARFPVQDYIEARGEAFARTVHPDRFLALSESLDLHQADPAALPPGALLVSFDTDSLVPPWLVEELARCSRRNPRHVVVPTLYGHDAFLKETGRMTSLLDQTLAPNHSLTSRPDPHTPEVIR